MMRKAFVIIYAEQIFQLTNTYTYVYVKMDHKKRGWEVE